MKTFFLYLFFWVFVQNSFGQSVSKLSTIILDAKNGFKNIIGTISSKQDGYATYTSTVLLESTSDNEILVFDSNGHSPQASYTAIIASDLTDEESKALLREWKKKVHQFLVNDQPVRHDQKTSQYEKNYTLITEKLECIIYASKPTEKNLWSVGITIARKGDK